MKKIFALLLMAVMSITLLTGCGSDPVYDDLTNYLNVEMVEVNADYAKITEEVGKWETYETDAELAKSINDILLPLVNGSLEKLEGVNPETAEVKELKEKYVGVMNAYKKGFEALYEGCETQDPATIQEGNDSINEGVALLDDYNASLEELAARFAAEIEY